MKLRLLPSAFHRSHPDAVAPVSQPLTTFVVSGAQGAGPLAIDAGSLGLVGEADQMADLREVLLTHAHIDHVATLPMWVEAVLSQGRAPVRVHATSATVAALRTHFFNDVLFPDLERIAGPSGTPLLELCEVPSDAPFPLAGFSVRPFPTAHPVPTHGFVLDDGEGAVLFGADGGPSESLWEAARSTERLRAIVLETSFPDPLLDVASSSGHLTPSLLRAELGRAPEGVHVLVHHLKPAHRDPITRAIEAIDDPRVRLLVPGVEVILEG